MGTCGYHYRMINKKFLAAAAVTIGVFAVGSTVSASVDPVDPEFEVSIVEMSFDYTVCPMVDDLVNGLTIMTGEYEMTLDMVVAWSVEVFESGYGSNLSELAEDRMIELLEDCVGY